MNHFLHFKDPVTGTYTNTTESPWRHFKCSLPAFNWQRDFGAYIAWFTFRCIYDSQDRDPFTCFLKISKFHKLSKILTEKNATLFWEGHSNYFSSLLFYQTFLTLHALHFWLQIFLIYFCTFFSCTLYIEHRTFQIFAFKIKNISLFFHFLYKQQIQRNPLHNESTIFVLYYFLSTELYDHIF